MNRILFFVFSFFMSSQAIAQNFTIIVLPDTQHYCDFGPTANQIFVDQMEWITANRVSKNIVFVTSLGDIVQNADELTEWVHADTCYNKIEDPVTTTLTDGIPYGLSVGNCDQFPKRQTGATSEYNNYFGVSRFTGRDYYGGNYGSKNDNSFQLFSASGLDFIILHLEYDENINGQQQTDVLNWADSVLTAHSDKRAIVTSHFMIDRGNEGDPPTSANEFPGEFSSQGENIFDALSDHDSLFLMLGGHIATEGERDDVGINGNTIYTLLSDYQDQPDGGNGWLRIMEFIPSEDSILISTYSPTYDNGDGTFGAYGTTPFEDMGGTSSNGFGGTGSISAPFKLYYDLSPPGQPTVNWTSPINGGLFLNLNPIALNVDASDNNGTITQVEYFVNGGSIGIDVVAPYSLSWTPPSFGSYLLKATATDNDGNTSSKEISVTFDDNPTINLAVQISDGDDDAEEFSGNINLGSSDLELVEENSSNNQTVGLRFNNLNIPNGAMISNAYIQFTADETQSQTTNLVIHGEDIDNSPPFTGSSFNVSNRTTTSASATWNPSPWLNIGAAGTNEQTSDLSAVLQEVVDGSGWVENNSMSFIITGSGHRTADSYDGSSTNAPTLHITFTPALNPLPVELTKFQAVQQNAHVELFWKTASERNTDHFVIERSHNGYSFLEIESVTSQGDGVTIQNYNAKDIFPYNGMNYYRLKIVDNDSIFEYSNIQIVHLESPSAVTFFPNPVNKSIQIEGLDENMKDGLIEIFDLEGKRIFVDQLPFEDGKLFISTAAINIYNPGTYFLRITEKIENHVFKFVKINGKLD
jgi:hypothetical protein